MPSPPARRRARRCLVLLCLCWELSCSGGADGLNPVSGKVLYKNEPLPGALVTFHPKGAPDMNAIPSVGLTREDGTFTLTTGRDDGAPAGEYVVTVICSEVPKAAKKSLATGGVETQDRLKGAYADRAKSTIRVEVKNGSNELEPFALK